MVKEHVKEVINEDYKKWTFEDNVIINFQTGGRKTTFILETFARYLREINNIAILYLVSRTALKKHIEKEIMKYTATNVVVMTYQDLENKILDEEEKLNNFRCIVCDECHYFITDGWNRKTEISWQYLINQKKSLKIWMSGTGQTIFQILKNLHEQGKVNRKPLEYKGKYDYQYIENIYFFNAKNNIEYIENTLKNITIGEKAIYFCSKKDDGRKIRDLMNKKNRKAFFISSGYNNKSKKTSKFVDVYDDEGELIGVTFEEDFLIATNVIDTGISLVDERIKHIIMDIPNAETLVQCIGRKRIKDGEKIVLHICNYTEGEITKYKRSTDKSLNEARDFMNSKLEYLKKYEKKRQLPANPFLYYSVSAETKEMKLNEIYYASEYLKSEDFKMQINQGFDTYLINKFFNGLSREKLIYPEMIKNQETTKQFEEYLAKVEGKKLFPEDQTELMSFISELNESKENKTFKFKTIVKCFEDNGIKYEIIKGKEDDRASDKYNKNYMIFKKKILD